MNSSKPRYGTVMAQLDSSSTDPAVRVRVSPELKAAWKAALKENKIKQQEAATALLEWVVTLDRNMRAKLFGQIEPGADFQQQVENSLPRSKSRKKGR